MVEFWTFNPKVSGSIPDAGTFLKFFVFNKKNIKNYISFMLIFEPKKYRPKMKKFNKTFFGKMRLHFFCHSKWSLKKRRKWILFWDTSPGPEKWKRGIFRRRWRLHRGRLFLILFYRFYVLYLVFKLSNILSFYFFLDFLVYFMAG